MQLTIQAFNIADQSIIFLKYKNKIYVLYFNICNETASPCPILATEADPKGYYDWWYWNPLKG